MDSILETYLNNIKASKSVSTYKTYTNAFEKWFPNGKCTFTLDYISKKLSDMKCSVNTKALRCTVLKKFLTFANNFTKIENLNVIIDLLNSVSSKEVIPEIATLEQYKEVIDYCKFKKDYRLQLAIMLMYENGLRISEVVGIQNKNYNHDKKTITILDTKNGNDYIIYLTSNVDNFIRKHVNLDLEYMFTNKQGNQITAHSLQYYLKKACDACGFPKLHCHSFRHGSATYLLDNDVNIFAIKEHLRHKSLQSTQRYLHLTEKQIKSVKNAFSNI